MPTLNIKNPRVYELAHELAEATGESMTSVIEVALGSKCWNEYAQRERQRPCSALGRDRSHRCPHAHALAG